MATTLVPIQASSICDRAVTEGFSGIMSLYEKYGSSNAHLEWATSETEVENPFISDLHQDYLRLRADADPVRWSDFHCCRHKGLLGDMHVLDMDGSTGSMRYRLFGTNVAHRYGKDLTGTLVQDNVPTLAALYHGLFLASVTSGRPIYSRHVPPEGSKVRDCQRIMLPFADNSGSFARLLVAHLPARTRVATAGSALSNAW